MKKIINIVPFGNIARKMQEADQNIFLVGGNGSGKTTTLEVLKNNPYHLIYGTIEPEEYLFIPDTQIFNLYYVLLIAKKILDDMVKNQLPISNSLDFINLNNQIQSLLMLIRIMYIRGNYDDKIDNTLLNNPGLIIERLKSLLSNYSEIGKDYLLVVDDFDKMGMSSQRFQKAVYSSLKDRIKFLLTVSDPEALKNPNILQDKGNVITLDYNQDLNIIRQILSSYLRNNLSLPMDILTDDIIWQLINQSRGNINLMLAALNNLSFHFSELRKKEYAVFIDNYFKDMRDINKTGYVERERKLYI